MTSPTCIICRGATLRFRVVSVSEILGVPTAVVHRETCQLKDQAGHLTQEAIDERVKEFESDPLAFRHKYPDSFCM